MNNLIFAVRRPLCCQKSEGSFHSLLERLRLSDKGYCAKRGVF